MLRRLYFLLPDTHAAKQLVNDLQNQGVARENMHSVATEGVDLSDLPLSSKHQRNDTSGKVEHYLWDIDLLLFFTALIALLLMSIQQMPGWTLTIPIAVMIITFFSGYYFIKHVPHVHLKEFEHALNHGEILLMIDVEKHRVQEILQQTEHHHPEAVTGGVGWSTSLLKI